MRTYFILHYDSAEAVNMLSDTEAGRLLKALFEYNRTGALPEHLKSGTAILFSQLRAQHDRDRQRYERKCRTNRENIQKRWEKECQEESELPETFAETGKVEEPVGKTRKSNVPETPEKTNQSRQPEKPEQTPEGPEQQARYLQDPELMALWKSRQRDCGMDS